MRDKHTYPLGGRLTDAFRLLDACGNEQEVWLARAVLSFWVTHWLVHSINVHRRVRDVSIVDIGGQSRIMTSKRSVARIREVIIRVSSS